MRRPVYPEPVKAPPKKAAKKAAKPPSKKPKTEIISTVAFEASIEELALQSQALRMSAEGYSHREIADELCIPVHRIPVMLVNAMGEYLEERNAAAEKYFAVHRRRYDLLIQKWMPLALGYEEEYMSEEGSMVTRIVPPSPEAGRIMASLQRDAAKMFGFNKLRVEHTGAHGGPIMNVNIDWSRATNEQLAQIKAGNQDTLRELMGPGASSGGPGDSS